MPLFNNIKTRKVELILPSRKETISRSKSRSNSFTRKRKLIARRFVSKLNSYKSKVLERSNKSRALTQKLKTTLNSAITIIKKSHICPICLSKIDLKESITTLQCGHTLHSRCLYNYVNNTRDVDLRCLQCRAPIQLTSLDPSKLKEELALKFKSDATHENAAETRTMWEESYAHVNELYHDIENSSDNHERVALLRSQAERAYTIAEEAQDMYNEALRLHIIAFQNYITYIYSKNRNNVSERTRQIL